MDRPAVARQLDFADYQAAHACASQGPTDPRAARASGAKVQNVATELGYSSVNAFITMFKKVLGNTPAQYFAQRSAAAVGTETIPND
jgi:AraC-like DNA-binding protein